MPRKAHGKPYNPQIRKSEYGSRIYTAWKKIRRNPHYEEWESFASFYEWAVESGFEIGARICRIDESEPFCPDNCVWLLPGESLHPTQSWADEWNKTVNRIRKHYGMPPLEGTDYGDY